MAKAKADQGSIQERILKYLGKRRSGYTAQDLADGVGVHKDYALAQLRQLRDDGKVDKVSGRTPSYSLSRG